MFTAFNSASALYTHSPIATPNGETFIKSISLENDDS
jgi:hypothetical protein